MDNLQGVVHAKKKKYIEKKGVVHTFKWTLSIISKKSYPYEKVMRND